MKEGKHEGEEGRGRKECCIILRARHSGKFGLNCLSKLINSHTDKCSVRPMPGIHIKHIDKRSIKTKINLKNFIYFLHSKILDLPGGYETFHGSGTSASNSETHKHEENLQTKNFSQVSKIKIYMIFYNFTMIKLLRSIHTFTANMIQKKKSANKSKNSNITEELSACKIFSPSPKRKLEDIVDNKRAKAGKTEDKDMETLPEGESYAIRMRNIKMELNLTNTRLSIEITKTNFSSLSLRYSTERNLMDLDISLQGIRDDNKDDLAGSDTDGFLLSDEEKELDIQREKAKGIEHIAALIKEKHNRNAPMNGAPHALSDPPRNEQLHKAKTSMLGHGSGAGKSGKGNYHINNEEQRETASGSHLKNNNKGGNPNSKLNDNKMEGKFLNNKERNRLFTLNHLLTDNPNDEQHADDEEVISIIVAPGNYPERVIQDSHKSDILRYLNDAIRARATRYNNDDVYIEKILHRSGALVLRVRNRFSEDFVKFSLRRYDSGHLGIDPKIYDEASFTFAPAYTAWIPDERCTFEWLMMKVQRFRMHTQSWRFVRIIEEKGKPGLKGVKFSFIAFGNVASYLDGDGKFSFVYAAFQQKAVIKGSKPAVNGHNNGELCGKISTILFTMFVHKQLTHPTGWNIFRVSRRLRICLKNGCNLARTITRNKERVTHQQMDLKCHSDNIKKNKKKLNKNKIMNYNELNNKSEYNVKNKPNSLIYNKKWIKNKVIRRTVWGNENKNKKVDNTKRNNTTLSNSLNNITNFNANKNKKLLIANKKRNKIMDNSSHSRVNKNRIKSLINSGENKIPNKIKEIGFLNSKNKNDNNTKRNSMTHNNDLRNITNSNQRLNNIDKKGTGNKYFMDYG